LSSLLFHGGGGLNAVVSNVTHFDGWQQQQFGQKAKWKLTVVVKANDNMRERK
jgi:hypothetical protein